MGIVQPIEVATCEIRCRETPNSAARAAAMPRGTALSAYRAASAALKCRLRSPFACARLSVSAAAAIAIVGCDPLVGACSTGTSVGFGMMLQVLPAS